MRACGNPNEEIDPPAHGKGDAAEKAPHARVVIHSRCTTKVVRFVRQPRRNFLQSADNERCRAREVFFSDDGEAIFVEGCSCARITSPATA
jgi:hypothetical protein